MKYLLQRVYALLLSISDNDDQIPADIVDVARDLKPDIEDAINGNYSEEEHPDTDESAN